MSESIKPTTKRSWWNKPSAWVGGFFLVVAAMIVVFAMREFSAKQEFTRRLEEIRKSGAPTDDASLDAMFNTITTSDNSVGWNEFSNLASGWVSTVGYDLPCIGSGVTPVSAYTDGDWPMGERVGELLQQIQPLLQQVHEVADNTNGPVWQPIHFDGFNTLLGPIQEARSISRLLQLDYQYAVYTKDRQRALRDVKSSLAAIKAYQWDSYAVAEFVNIAQMGMVYNSVEHSLKSSMWTVEDMRELAKMFDKPIDLKSRWSKVSSTELAAALALIQRELNEPSGLRIESSVFVWAAKLPSSQLRLLQDFQAYQSVGNASPDNILFEANKIDQQGVRGMLSGAVIPSTTQIARVYINMEEARRMLVTAIALKQFKLTHGEFPLNLELLLNDSTLGITRGELEGFDHRLFRFKHNDAQSVFIWNTRPVVGVTDLLPGFDQDIPKYDKDSGYPLDGRYGTVVELR